jgi:hypothetical protein
LQSTQHGQFNGFAIGKSRRGRRLFESKTTPDCITPTEGHERAPLAKV